ncbi:Brct domain dna repair protein [Thalictrum thalictroides]|uniref:Brct domain dna repair protein n=1 Tax=Thalictrum thalictroides TaxID=46969 RepID=A0A7J6XES0_THATH|nr:Brct domain dna repair protein [Thalictrum thalictroides]
MLGLFFNKIFGAAWILNHFHSSGGRKLEHALKYGLKNGLSVVTLGWFVDSVRKNVRLSESLYSVKGVGDSGLQVEFNRLVRVSDTEKSCLPARLHERSKQANTTQQAHLQSSGEDFGASRAVVLSGQSIYVDSEISDDVRRKVIDAATKGGVAIISSWFMSCGATYVVCEGPSIWRYLGHVDNIVTPQWFLKTTKENYVQRLAHLSTDLAREVSAILENIQYGFIGQGSLEHPTNGKTSAGLEERQRLVDLAKTGVRNRRRPHMQTHQTQIRPITPSILLDTICWSVSDLTSAACVYTDRSGPEDHSGNKSIFVGVREDGRGPEVSFENLCRPLRESEKSEKIFKNHFLTILFPIDRFSEIGPSSRTFFSDNGFTCLQVLDYIYMFYQENMLADEVVVAIHTDSRHADQLRSVYVSKESLQSGNTQFRRIDFLGTRRSFEMLKRVSGDNNSNVYELIIRA